MISGLCIGCYSSRTYPRAALIFMNIVSFSPQTNIAREVLIMFIFIAEEIENQLFAIISTILCN